MREQLFSNTAKVQAWFSAVYHLCCEFAFLWKNAHWYVRNEIDCFLHISVGFFSSNWFLIVGLPFICFNFFFGTLFSHIWSIYRLSLCLGVSPLPTPSSLTLLFAPKTSTRFCCCLSTSFSQRLSFSLVHNLSDQY